MRSVFEQNFKNRFIKHITKFVIIEKKNLHCYFVVYRFYNEKIEFRFYKKIF